ncbi:hypothetical protein [Collimonas pratensis]|uniref:hypothetical protein n=1 Tax=Collimonas pratensis TaxID=279113 RepID=UPI0012378E1D|nr:hypothetical protein [Collimonas pratensis]NKI68242.1 hypothetical protein [Collimonas pratensis]
MLFLFFLGYTILAALKPVAYFLLVALGGNVAGKQSQIGTSKVAVQFVLLAKKICFLVVVVQKILDASLRRRLTNRT